MVKLNDKEKQVKNKLLLSLAALMLVTVGIFASGCAGTTAVSGDSQQSGIWVSGNGKVSVTPDTANLSLGVQVEAVGLAEANQQAADVMDAVIEALKDNGIAEKDITTSGFNISPVYEYDKETGRNYIRGYQVSNAVNLKVREIENTGAVIDAAVAAGGDAVRVSNIYFSIDDLSQAQDDARELALLDAKAKAEQIARVTGVSLGKVTYVAETSSGGARVEAPGMVNDGKEGSVTPVLPGETDVVVTVQVIYSIK
jgi:uncharacterized protein YggE